MAKRKENTPIITTDNKALVPRPTRSLADFHGEWVVQETGEEDDLKELDANADSSNESNYGVYQSFAKQIAKLKRLGEEEEYALGLLAHEHQDKEAQKKLVLHNMRLALKMAHQYRRDWTNLMDLVQEASAGMAIAAKKWDPRMQTRFGTYAAYWIRASLTKFLMTNARLIHTGNTRAGRKVYFSLPAIQRKLLLEGKQPTADIVAQEVGEDPQEVELIMARLKGKEASLSTPMDDDGSTTLGDTLSNKNEDPESLVAHKEMQTIIKEVMEGFERSLTNERDMAIWRENLISNEPINLVDLGKRYGVSKQRMGQLSTRIKRAFRRYIIEQLGTSTQLSWLFRED